MLESLLSRDSFIRIDLEKLVEKIDILLTFSRKKLLERCRLKVIEFDELL